MILFYVKFFEWLKQIQLLGYIPTCRNRCIEVNIFIFIIVFIISVAWLFKIEYRIIEIEKILQHSTSEMFLVVWWQFLCNIKQPFVNRFI